MRIYLDSNVYSYVDERHETRETAAYFRSLTATILVSDAVVLEAAHISSREDRLKRFECIRAVGTRRLDPPFPFREAMEVLAEVRRCRPDWLHPRPDESSVERFLKLNRHLWRQLRNDRLFDPIEGLPAYRAAAEPTTSQFLARQRAIRQLTLNAASVEFQAGSQDLQQCLEPLDQSERYWRLNAMGIWAQALEGHPGLRDYSDYLGPYLDAPTDARAWQAFWIREVQTAAMPVGRLHAAVEFHQASEKVTHGNAIDTHHGVHLLDCDVFLTADGPFYRILRRITADGIAGGCLGIPLLVERRAGRSAVGAIRRAIEEAGSDTPARWISGGATARRQDD